MAWFKCDACKEMKQTLTSLICSRCGDAFCKDCIDSFIEFIPNEICVNCLAEEEYLDYIEGE
jgi:hypothetical protein